MAEEGKMEEEEDEEEKDGRTSDTLELGELGEHVFPHFNNCQGRLSILCSKEVVQFDAFTSLFAS